MRRPPLISKYGALRIAAILLGCCSYLPIVGAQGLFPTLENVAAFKPISIEPPNATCGFPRRSVFCHSDESAESLQTCAQRLCVQDCPYRSVSPLYHPLLLGDLGACIREDRRDVHPGSRNSSSSFIFYDHQDCVVTAPALGVGGSFTLTVWLKPEQDGVMCVMETSADGQIVLKLTISEKETVFYYRTVNGLQPPITVMTQGRFPAQTWIHLSVQLHYTKISFFINGPDEDLTAFDSRHLTDPIYDTDNDAYIRLGQNINGTEQFIGRMQDFRWYKEALTNREILDVFSEKFPPLPIRSECRCPGSHPRPEQVTGRFCLPNGVHVATKDKVLRLHPEAHPMSYMNDNDLHTTWISSLLSAEDTDKGVAITLDLASGQYQVFYISVRFYSPMPKALVIQRKKHMSAAWEDWQYFASDCDVFGMEDNGRLEYPDSVNCLQLPKDPPISQGNVTLSLLMPEPNHRPGYNDFYQTRELQEFVTASLVRIQMIGQHHTQDPAVSPRHRYYGIREITVSGRCNCHGHANSCDTSVSPYKCLCDTTSYTDGDNCDRCLPLFNNKPFRQGDHVNAYNCLPCQCYNHSSSCHYNATADPQPHDHYRGGGGVCDNCEHNTTGRNCHVCKDNFYRRDDADLSAEDVCQLCDCADEGTVNKSQNCDKIGGQCSCKRNVRGRRCHQCKDGFYNLQGSNPDGCQPCGCNTAGTLSGDNTCHQTTGQCKCKPNVIGPRCDRCKLGFRQDTFGQDSCIQCTCNAYGSINQFCNPTSGQCKCRRNVSGLNCDTCIDIYYGLDADGCKPCRCDTDGIIAGTVCDAVTGQCLCQPNVGGRRCNECLDGYYTFTENGSVSCRPCQCERSGTADGSQSCDKYTGQCECKAGVTGQRCTVCIRHMYNLTGENTLGCQDCDCDPMGTLPSTACDPITGHCLCLPNYRGRKCDTCKPGFYLPADRNMGCTPCFCHTKGSINDTCNEISGNCYCRDHSLSGPKCDQCSETFYGFDVDLGRCQPCTCNTAGAVNASCHPVTGQCFCRRFVKGFSCSHCVEGANSLDGENPYGCSSTPSQQRPPRGHVLNSTTVLLTWAPPDYPNTNRINYVLYRDGLRIYHTTDYYPFSAQSYMDAALLPYTAYSYRIDARNVHGAVSSPTVVYRTRAGVPSGQLHLRPSRPVGQQSVSLNWTITPHETGPIETFRLTYTPVGSSGTIAAYEGPDSKATVHDLTPFTKYNFSVQACTSEGCLQSLPITVVTAQAPPAGQAPPVLRNSSSTDLHLQWSPPSQPNGVIIRHELYMRSFRQTIERRVFQASGWLNPQTVVESANENALKPPVTSAIITNLEPNTEYEICIVSTNMAGSVASEWITCKTAESEPTFMPPPSVLPLSPHSLNVSWERPANNAERGEITGYTVNMVSQDPPEETLAGGASSAVIYVAESHELFYAVTGLEPYRDYTFTVTLCNKVGCVTSDPGLGKTLSSAPGEINAPLVEGISGTVMKIAWSAPAKLNGPLPVYKLERTEPSLAIHSETRYVKGTRFPGHGYIRFPASTWPVDFTGIKVEFRTKAAEGLILCAVSAGMTGEYFALRIRKGRPYFLFDPQDSAATVTPTNDGGRRYDDNNWHQILITRHHGMEIITVDGKYSGSAAANGHTVVGENTTLFVGGLPEHPSTQRQATGSANIIPETFAGCLGDILVQHSVRPNEEWELLDWDKAEERSNVYERWEGCPETVEGGAHFLNFGFLELPPTVFPAGPSFDISFMFRTDQLSGLLLFIYNTNGLDHIMAQLNNGILTLECKNKSWQTQVSLWAGLSYCDGRWNNVHLTKEGSSLSVLLNDLEERVAESETAALEINVTSPVFVGGVPERVRSLFPELQALQGFGGCMKDLSFSPGVVVATAEVSSSAVRVSLDGCPSACGSVTCRGNDSTIIYRGREQLFHDHNVQPFTEYLYRVIASNEAGSGASDWSRGRSKASVPTSGKTPLRVLGVSGYSVTVAWDRPAGVRGVIQQYILTAEAASSPNVSTVRSVIPDTSQDNGTLAGLLPFTQYAVTLSACTDAGCSENSHLLNVSTLQEAPGGVQAPATKSSPNSLYLRWFPPEHPNGVITMYTLYMDGRQIYTGSGTEYNVTGLATFTAHQFMVAACTIVGCTNSSRVTLWTAQLAPEYVSPPVLTVLDSASIHAQWSEPETITGVVERYLLHITDDVTNGTSWNTVYNCTDLFLDYTIPGLTPGTRYSVKMSACTGGGCVMSDSTEASTEESAPSGVHTPKIHSHSPDSFNVSWSKPQHPNGIIKWYGLYMDGILMQNSSHLSYFVDGLAPGSKHSFRLQACTAKGCALGEKENLLNDLEGEKERPLAKTSICTEFFPEICPSKCKIESIFVNKMFWSLIEFFPEICPSKCKIESIFVNKMFWSLIEFFPEICPSKCKIESIFVNKMFWSLIGDEIRNISHSKRILHQSHESKKWVSVRGLVPFSSYTVEVNASNSQGHVTSDPSVITMPPGAPDGVLPPRLSSANPTSLQVVWSSPVRNNAPGLPHYRLQMRSTDSTNKVTDVFSGPSASFTYTIKDLSPYTTYEVRILACNAYGDTYSRWTNVSTGQDKPEFMDPPLPSSVKPRSITITWQSPTKPNGIITHYNLYQDGSLQVVVPGNSSSFTFDGLVPYTSYRYQLEGCTSAGCSLSQESLVIETLPDAPSYVLAPDLWSESPTSVTIRWKPPLHPNGVLEKFSIERRLKGAEDVHMVVTLPGDAPRQYMDETSDLNPWVTYEYRIVATTYNGGTNRSDWSEVTTRPSRPVGVQAPEVTILGPYAAKVTWKPPLKANGEILRYEIRIPEPRVVITDTTLLSYTVTGLIPYTNYSVSVVASSGGGTYIGGSTESLPTLVTTQPAPPEGVSPLSVVPVSETFIALTWQLPSRPNGPDIRYELLRRTILQPLASNPPEDLNLWQNIYSGTRWFYEDKALSRYTSYEYRLIVHNAVGHTPGTDVIATTLPGAPVRGSHLTAHAVSHTAIEASWSRPTVQDLQGDVDHYTVVLKSAKYNKSLTFPADVTHAEIGGLHPNTKHRLYLEVSNGPHSISGGWVHVTTLDGEPQGVLPPEVVAINSTAARVIWTPPSNPNGVVTEYSIYVNDKRYETEGNTPHQLLLGGLAPYTVYNVQVKVCTVYACIKSNATQVTTVEGKPNKIPWPKISRISSRSVQIHWAPPEEPNGIILGYEVRRKGIYPCDNIQRRGRDENGKLCLLVTCRRDEDVCGDKCYNPYTQVCCRGVLHDRRDGYECYEEEYIVSSDDSPHICCAGQIHVIQPDHQCCGGYYMRIPAGEVCCYDRTQNAVAAGDGDSCCGGNPYWSSGHQICCGDSLYDGFNQRCCGGKIISQHFICCGDGDTGTMYRRSAGLSCCGTHYVNLSETTCCSGSNGQFKAHLKLNNGMPLKCCETEVITAEEGCCNGIGYNPVTHVCSDKPRTESLSTEQKCHSDILCPVSASSAAYCGQCHFNATTDSCFWTERVINGGSGHVAEDTLCLSDEEIVYTGGTDKYSFTDTGVNPDTTYEYRVSAWNSFDYSFSNVSRVTTYQDRPQGIGPPWWATVGSRKDVISLSWEEPKKLNGNVYYVLLRDGVERFNGSQQSFQDQGGIQPYKEYTYKLRACTVAGCSDSAKVFAAVEQGIPENVSPPVITTVNATALHLSWAAPKRPNGDIREYQIHQTDGGLIHVSTAGRRQYTVSGLRPYTKYVFFLTACTSVGCNSSQMASGYTSPAPPQGVRLEPCHVTINSSVLELYWTEPEMPNGMISQYRLIRNRTVISTRSGDYLRFTDVGLQPNSRYFYQLEARTEAGSNVSNIYVVETPGETPEKIPVPYNVTVLGPDSVFVAWDVPGVYNPSMPLEYNILLNAGCMDVHPAGGKQFIILEDLIPGAQYYIRVQACQNGPESQTPSMELSIQVPAAATFAYFRTASGYRMKAESGPKRLAGHEGIVILLIWSAGTLEHIDSSEELQPYTAYEYSITAQNSAGSVRSLWSFIYTPEAAPEDIRPPNAQVTSAYSTLLDWMAPAWPHGVITHYRIMYQDITGDSNSSPWSTVTVPAGTYQAKVFGLLPHTTYNICIEASNSAGSASSAQISIKTWEAAPRGLNNLTVVKKEKGRALLLSWSQPQRMNGLLLTYTVYSDGNPEYSGLSRQFLLRRLEPYTVYTLVLEACTAGGCTRTVPQLVQTEEASPSSQLPPQIKSHNASHIQLTWLPPVHPNGKILRYDLMKRCTKGNSPSSRNNASESVVFTERNAEQSAFTYTDGGLQPWTQYEYKVRGWNSVGFADSIWIMGQTTQAAPSGLHPPKLFHGENRPNQVIIQWSKPEEENGNILYYKLQKDNITSVFSLDPATFSYTDEEVLPNSEYTYCIVACTLGGCAVSDPTHIRTLEGPPDSVNPPTVEPISATEVNVTWSPPSIPNGQITKYMVHVDNETYYAGKRLWITLSNLQPFTAYNTRLVACTNGGCTSSSPASTRTMEARPSHMVAPSLTATSAQSIKISWRPPDRPNGDIASYGLRRDGQLVYVGLDTYYHDLGLEPGTEYTYTVQASNSQGSCLSIPAKIRTHPSLPSGMEPPTLHARSANEILVTWKTPLRPNGIILNYTLYVQHMAEMKEIQYYFNSSIISLNGHSFVIKDLNPYNKYEAKVEACTLLGCAVSEWATVHTLEAAPESQPAPLIDVQTNNRAPLLAWNGPQEPNGKIMSYEIYRRRLNDAMDPVSNELVFNGSSKTFQDVTLLPYTEYEYQVWAVNSAGRTPSSWTSCRTGPAPPEGVHAPTFHRVSSTSAVANITPPTKPNGVVILYRLFSRTNRGGDTVLSEGISNTQTVYGLTPFTNYSVGVEACTCVTCCSQGPVAALKTLAATPSHQRPPRVTHKASRAVSLQWSEPRSPNGIIQRYEVHVQVICPLTAENVGTSCTEGPLEVKYSGRKDTCEVTDLQPFTTYRLRVASYNSEGSTSSDWVTCTTSKEKPVYRSNIYVLSNLTTIFLDWRLSFQLNGQLREFVVAERGQRLYSGLDSSIHIPKTTDKTFYFQVTCTTDMGSVSTPIVRFNSATGLAPAQTFPNTRNGTEARGNAIYTELWFILLMALIGLLLLAIFLSLILQRKLTKQPYPRERPQLVPAQKRMSPAGTYLQNDTYTGMSDIKISGMETLTSQNTTVVRKTNQSQISHSFSQNSLYRSASQLLASHDKKSIVDGSIWDLPGHDSGMYMDDEDLISTIKSFSTVTKQHTAFTDTPL
ncbi:usherin [Pseudophryne corroboree]|uniref:usherin n=1 Tax=Pseudophryne corroboree TaxID=495146 RepID=UPI003081F5F8